MILRSYIDTAKVRPMFNAEDSIDCWLDTEYKSQI